MSVSPSMTAHLNDRSLLRRYAKIGCEASFAELVSRHGRMVYGVCRRELKDHHLAEDAAQVTFLLLARKSPSLLSSPYLAGWLFKAALLSAKNLGRAERSRRAREERVGRDMLRSSSPQTASWKTVEPELNAALAALKDADRDVVLLRYMEGRSWAEVGAALGLSEDTAQKRGSRALQTLRRRLGPVASAVSMTALASLLAEDAAHSVPESLDTALGAARNGMGASSLHHIAQGVSFMMGVQKYAPLIAAASIAMVAGAAYGALGSVHRSKQIKSSGNMASDPAALAALKSVEEHYSAYSAFSMDIEQHDSSGLYPGDYRQHFDWRKGGAFTLKAVPGPSAKVPDFTGDGTQVVTVKADGTRKTDDEAPAPNTLPGWEVTGGLIASLLQNTPTRRMIFGGNMAFAMGPRTKWHGMAVQELRFVLGVHDGTRASLFVDPITHEYVGEEAVLKRDGSVGYAIYSNQQGR